MITLLKFRYYLKLSLIWLKSHWKQVLTVLAFLFISISSRNKNMSLSRVLEGTKKLHDDEVNALQSSYESQLESILNTEKQLKETLSSVEKKYAEENKKLDSKKKREIEKIIKENSDNPDAITKRIAEITGFEFVIK